jgi:beta-N-acetylhexosaminidase
VAAPDCAEVLPAAAQAGQLLMVMVTAPRLARDSLVSGRAGGFGLKGRQSADIGDELAAAVDGAPLSPFVASDEEGGTVQRLGAALGPLPSAAELADRSVEEVGRLMGDYAQGMVDLGVTMNFAPVADLGTGSGLGSRTFGDDPEQVAALVESSITAQTEAGVIAVVKHWPGIGSGGTDPHVALDSLSPLEILRERDLLVFDRAIAAGAPAIMVGHASVEGLTAADEPTSLSRSAITDELRGRQGFDGLVVTDSLGMGAVLTSTPQDEAAERAIAAGADIALLSGAEVVPAAHGRLTEAIEQGRIPAEQVADSVRRVLALKGIRGECRELADALADVAPATGESSEDADPAGPPATDDRTVVDEGI